MKPLLSILSASLLASVCLSLARLPVSESAIKPQSVKVVRPISPDDPNYEDAAYYGFTNRTSEDVVCLLDGPIKVRLEYWTNRWKPTDDFNFAVLIPRRNSLATNCAAIVNHEPVVTGTNGIWVIRFR